MVRAEGEESKHICCSCVFKAAAVMGTPPEVAAARAVVFSCLRELLQPAGRAVGRDAGRIGRVLCRAPVCRDSRLQRVASPPLLASMAG